MGVGRSRVASAGGGGVRLSSRDDGDNGGGYSRRPLCGAGGRPDLRLRWWRAAAVGPATRLSPGTRVW